MKNKLENRLSKIEGLALPQFPQFTGTDLIGWTGLDDDESYKAAAEKARTAGRLLIVLCPPAKVI